MKMRAFVRKAAAPAKKSNIDSMAQIGLLRTELESIRRDQESAVHTVAQEVEREERVEKIWADQSAGRDIN